MTSCSEQRRLQVLDDLDILDSDPEPGFDAIVLLAQQLFGTAAVTISLIDETRQWFKARVGLDAVSTPRSDAFCDHAIRTPDVMVVPDASRDERFQDNPLVLGDPRIRFYAGAPVLLEGAALGTLCLIDPAPRAHFAPRDRALLAAMAQTVGEMLRSRAETARSRRAERLAAARSRQLDLAEALAGVGHWSLDIATGRVAWSDEVYRIHGVDAAAFDPQLDDALQFYPDDDRERVAAHVARAVQTGDSYAFKAHIVRASDGALRDVMCKAEVELDETGVPVVMFGVFQDITDQEALLHRVEQEGERFRLLADNATDIIATFSIEAVFGFVSPAITTVLGHDPAELVGRRTYDIIHPDDHAEVTRRFRAFVAGGCEPPSFRVEYRALHADGTTRWIEAHPRALFDRDGQLIGFQDVARDVTARKALEAELIAAREQAQSAAQAKADFLANMSHELRTPLNSILGFAGVLAAAPSLTASERRYAELITGAGSTLLSVVNDVLDLSRVEAGAISLEREAVDLEPFFSDALELVRGQAQAKGLEVRLERPAGPMRVLCDAGRLRQVVLNLLANAVKFTEAGSVSLRVDAEADGDEAVLTIAVADTGIGIPADQLAAIFQRFEQADNSISRRFGGTGLGLSISRALVERMGGRIEVESVAGRGSTFRVNLRTPLVDAAAARQERPEASSSSRLQGLRVLAAEDVAMNQELIELFLEPLGVRLTPALNGVAAVQCAERERFDLILMDMQMPDMDGVEATRRIRAGGGPSADTPIIALTANVLPAEIAKCRAAGMDDHVGKPFDAATLVARIEAWTGQGRSEMRRAS